MRRNDLPVLEAAEITEWFRPAVNHLSEALQTRFLNAVSAVTAVLTGTSTITAAAEDNHLCRKRVRSMAARAVELGPDGEPTGFRVCVPYGVYRSTAIDDAAGMPRAASSNALRRMLACQPKIAQLVEAYSHPLPPGRPPKSFKRLHDKILAELRRLDLHDFYPLNAEDKGWRALLRHIRRVRIEGEPWVFDDVFCDSAPAQTSLWEAYRGRVFDRTEFDAHRIDVETQISVELPNGAQATRKVTALWLLVEVETESRAIVSWVLRVGRSYNNLDVATCLARGMQPWSPRELSVPGLEYAPNAGMPAGIPGVAAAMRSRCVALDNAKAHHSLMLEEAFCRARDGVMLFGRPHEPRSRPIVEQLFLRLEKGGLRLIAGGFEPATRLGEDRVRISDFAPEDHPVQMHLLEQLVDVIVANYNATPHPALGSMSPLQYLQARAQAPGWAYMPSDRAELARDMGSVLIPVEVKGNFEKKIMPHVNFLYVKYRAPELDGRWELVGKTVYARIYRHDLRTITLYHSATKPIGMLRAMSPWSQTPHDETTRRLICQWSKAPDRLEIAGAECAVAAYLAFLRRKAPTSQQAIDQLARMQHQPATERPAINSLQAIARVEAPLRSPRRRWVSLDRKMS
jgi:hypothetical protein